LSYQIIYQNSVNMNTRNQVQLIGNLGADPELKRLTNGNAVANAQLAINKYYKNSEGEEVNNTQWLRLTGWGKTAERMERTMKKGSQIAVYGALDISTYLDKQGVKKYSTSIIVNDFVVVQKIAK